jgi:hypothetical protein
MTKSNRRQRCKKYKDMVIRGRKTRRLKATDRVKYRWNLRYMNREKQTKTGRLLTVGKESEKQGDSTDRYNRQIQNYFQEEIMKCKLERHERSKKGTQE